MGFNPIKQNVVALKGYNDDEFLDLARLSFSYPFHIRFIEYMPIGNPQMKDRDYILADDIHSHLSALGKLEPIQKHLLDGPAERFRFEGAKGEIGFIRPLSQHFCSACNRLRLTANGQLRPCLLSDKQVDLKACLRNGGSDHELVDVFIKAVAYKCEGHRYAQEGKIRVLDQMSGIGG